MRYQCVKCGEYVEDPKYESLWWGGRFTENLRWTCRCGYTWSTPTLDAVKQVSKSQATHKQVTS